MSEIEKNYKVKHFYKSCLMSLLKIIYRNRLRILSSSIFVCLFFTQSNLRLKGIEYSQKVKNIDLESKKHFCYKQRVYLQFFLLVWQLLLLHPLVCLREGHFFPPLDGYSTTFLFLRMIPIPHSVLHSLQSSQLLTRQSRESKM